MPDALVIDVLGRPAPQGSKRTVGQRRSRVSGRMVPIVVEQSPHVAAWRGVVARAAAAQVLLHPGLAIGRGEAAEVWATHYLARPVSHMGTGRNAGLLRPSAPAWPLSPPDVDKLMRATLDGLVEGGALADDALVVRAHPVKVWADEHAPGAVIRVGRLEVSGSASFC